MVTDGLHPFAVLLFIGAGLTAFALAGTYLFSRITKRERLARISARVFVGGAVLYLAIILTGSIASQSRVLAPGEEKHICEIDCHLAYSVTGAKADSVGGGLIRHVVTVKVRFDEETISSRRSRTATLTPNRRYVALIDAQGRQYAGSTDGLRRPLIPGESYTTDIVFDVPAAAQSLRLVLRNNDAETAFIAGHENSLLHGKTTFALVRAS